jgi:RPA family protein
MPTIGRNPADFDITYDVTMGGRIYEDDAATTFITIPSATSTVSKPLPDAYVVEAAEEEVTGAFALFTSSIAAIAVLFMAF